MMRSCHPQKRLLTVLLAGSLVVPCFTATLCLAAEYGRVTGSVTDTQGNPLMGATVLIMGPVMAGPRAINSAAERVITDAHGRFAVEHLLPGWYSLKVTSATRVPVLRNSVRVMGGQTSTERFVLSDIFAPVHFQVPSHDVSSWGEDWKWVLRTSAATRPILRYQEVKRSTRASTNTKPALPASRRLVGMLPGSARREALAGDPGYGSVLAYLRPLSENTDLLVAGSMTANGISASSLATAFRKNLTKGDPQELALVMHQFSFADGVPLAIGDARESLARAQGMVASYSHTRHLSDSVTLVAGFEVNYLNAARDAATAQPRLTLAYVMSPRTTLAFQYGAARAGSADTMLERVGLLNAFPRVTLRGYRPRLEQLNHTELSVNRKLGKNSRVEVAAYRDALQNAAVWGFGGDAQLSRIAGNFLPNPAASGVILNGGDYRSSGVRAAYLYDFRNNLEAALAYAVGNALTVNGAALTGGGAQADSLLWARRSQSVAGRVSARLPKCHTQITTSYEWLPPNRVTAVDPYGQAELQLQPYLGLQIRQPLPALTFLPARIVALADFRNLLAQGYTPWGQAGEKPMLLTAAYRSFRGGFSVQF